LTDNFVLGLSGEFWGADGEINSNMAVYGYASVTKGSGNSTGFNFFAGYKDTTLQFSSREIVVEGDSYMTNVSLPATDYALFDTEAITDETEVSIRHLFRLSPVSPYLIAGYTLSDVDLDMTFIDSTPAMSQLFGAPAVNGSTFAHLVPKFTSNNKYKAYFLGVGGIVPFSKRFGLRGDFRYSDIDIDVNASNGFTTEKYGSNGEGLTGTATLYANLFKGVNAQIGGRYVKVKSDRKVADYEVLCYYLMLGYSYKF